MPLNTIKLNQDIKRAFEAQKENTGNQDQAIAKIAADLTRAIDAYVRSGLVITDPGQAVTTAGTAVAQTGATTAPGTGRIT